MATRTILLLLFLLPALLSKGQAGFKIHNGANFTVHDNADVALYSNTMVGGNFRTYNCLIRFYGQTWTNESTALFQDESASGAGFSGTGGQFYFMQPNPLTGTTSAQTIQGGLSNIYTLNGLSFPNLVIDNPNHVTLTGSHLRIRNDFSFLSGKLITGAQSIGIGGIINGQDASHYFVTGNTGSLVRYNVGNTDVEFPVGYDQTTYNPVTIKEAGTADHFAVTALQHLLLQGGSGSAATINAVDASWHIQDAVAGGNNLTVTPSWVTTDELPGFNRNASAVSRFVSMWDVSGATAASGTTTYSQRRTNITSIGYFSVQEPGQALPLFLTDFKGTLQNNNAMLEWRTAHEEHMDRFTILHSTNGRDFTVVGQVPAHNSQSNVYYFTHPNLPSGRHYYRLTIADLDGTIQYSRIITLYLNSMSQVLVYPTVTQNRLNVLLPDNITYQKAKATLLGPGGQTAGVFHLQKGNNQLHLGNLAAGAYSLRIDTDHETIVRQIIIAH